MFAKFIVGLISSSLLFLCTSGTSFSQGVWGYEGELAAIDAAAGDYFGSSVSISGDQLIVGAPQNDDMGTSSGSAYIFERSDGEWVAITKLLPSDGAASDYFGQSVSISENMAIIGSWGDDDHGSSSGSAYIFEKIDGVWTQTAKLTALDGAAYDNFGRVVGISMNYAIVGAYADDDNGSSSGSAYIYEKVNGVWVQAAKLTASDGASSDYFGGSVCITDSYAAIGAYGDDDMGSMSGSVYLFENNGGSWNEAQKLSAGDGIASERFGWSVSLSNEQLVVGAWGDNDKGTYSGSAYVYERIDSIWTESAKLTAFDGATYDYFGYAVSISDDRITVGAYGDDDNGSVSGSAYLFEKKDGDWGQGCKLTAEIGAAYDYFGRSVSISGDTAVSGALYNDEYGSGSGIAYTFRVVWQGSKIVASDGEANDQFGSAVAINQDQAIIGAKFEGDNGPQSGAAYIYENQNGEWVETAKITASDGMDYDYFGASVSISNNQAIVGAWGNDDYGMVSGSAYIFEKVNGDWTESIQLFSDDCSAADYFGTSVAISNNMAVIGANGDDDNGSFSGSAYVFEKIGGVWMQTSKLIASDGVASDSFGCAVAIAGDQIIIGAKGNDEMGNSAGAAYIFEKIDSVWVEVKKFTATDGGELEYFGSAVAISGDQVIVGAYGDADNGSYSGSAYIFEKIGGSWIQVEKFSGVAGERFGYSVSITGDKAAIGAYSESCYIFEKIDSIWSQQPKITAGDAASTGFGKAVAISADSVLAGAYAENDGTGSAYIYEKVE